MSASSRNHTPKSSARSSTARAERTQDFTAMPSIKDIKLLDPCAATASMFLYGHGPLIVCCHHDSLAVERTFARHADQVRLLAIDNQSEIGGGRQVVSYDAGQTAIVWDLMTGIEVARFASYETLTAAAWMRNGNVAFGNTQGNIILFEPTTSEHISSRTIDQIAVTALAPSADCRTFAIGYQNGSLLVATLQPRFTILHNLTTSRAPSPIVTLAWHASSSRQKSDMLAVQTHDGDLRVWSVPKNYKADDPARVVRILRRRDSGLAGPNWMGWSKNGRIIQFSDSETLSWDVRTKHVTYDSIPTLEHVKGLAVYGPGATLFTVGPDGTVQQFDLNSPSIMVADVQHAVERLPPSPPNSVQEPDSKLAQSTTTSHTTESESSSIPFEIGVSESDDDHTSPFARFSRRPHLDSSGGDNSQESASPLSSRSGVSSLAKSSTGGTRAPGHNGSMRSRGMTENTYISAGSSLSASTVGLKEPDTYSMGYSLPSTSVPSATSSRSRHRPSRLRHEVPRSPDDNKVHDLFKFTRTRLSDIPYKHPMGADNSCCLTNDDLRKQMLSTIFGWHDEVESLIRDEMRRHLAGSASRILLAKWLGDLDADIMVGSSENMSSSDWMLLALSGIGGQPSQHKLGRAYVQRLLESGDIHVAVTIMLGMGDDNDAIEIYISHKRYMEALILACLAFPGVWERQAAIIRKWGEWAVQHGQQQLAIRCFACTGQESTEPWRSPSAEQLNFQSMTPTIPEVLSPPLSPPGIQRGPQRSIAKTSALKLITSFGDAGQKAKFYSQNDGGPTPIAAGVTPIAESAVSPGVFDAATALLRPSSNSRFNTPTSARPNGSGSGRRRLPSIGELPSDLNREALSIAERRAHTPKKSGSARKSSLEADDVFAETPSQQTPATSPMVQRDGYQRVVNRFEGARTASPNRSILTVMQAAQPSQRNGSRDRIPRGLNMQLRGLEQTPPLVATVTSPEQSSGSPTRLHWPSRRRGPGSVASSVTSASSGGQSLRASHKQRDDFVHSLEAAQPHDLRRDNSRTNSAERARESSRGRHASRDGRGKSKEASEDRGRTSAREWAKPKRSPTSPIPMSPEDLAMLSAPRHAKTDEPAKTAARASSGLKAKSGSRTPSLSRRRQRLSPDGRARLQALSPLERSGDEHDERYRCRPSSPTSLSAKLALHHQESEDEEDLRKALMEQEGFRAKHSRSTSRGLAAHGGGPSPRMGTRREPEVSGREEAGEALDTMPAMVSYGRAASTEHAGDLRRMKDERQRKREEAARELEERRRSLAKRPQAPQIPHPNEFDKPAMRVGVEMADAKVWEHVPPRCATEPPKSMYARNAPFPGLPSTPKAMRLEQDSSDQTSPEVPRIPAVPSPYSSSYSSSYRSQEEPVTPPQKEQRVEPLTLLPSTVYQPPRRLGIARSMSAPIPDDSGHVRRHARMTSNGEVGGIDKVMNGPRRRSQDELIPPPPPPPPIPAPPFVLKELQHLAASRPPPRAMPRHAQQQSQAGGALGSGLIEIVMDEDEVDPFTAAPNDGMVPVLAPPTPRRNRGRSLGESSFRGKPPSEAGGRVRSASRGRKGSGSSIKSPPLDAVSEFYHQLSHKSPIAGVPSPPMMYDASMVRSPIEQSRKHMAKALPGGEMI